LSSGIADAGELLELAAGEDDLGAIGKSRPMSTG
jgi:hypothetical protein